MQERQCCARYLLYRAMDVVDGPQMGGKLPRDRYNHQEVGMMILANAINHLIGKPSDYIPSVEMAVRKGLVR